MKNELTKSDIGIMQYIQLYPGMALNMPEKSRQRLKNLGMVDRGNVLTFKGLKELIDRKLA